MSSSWAIWIAEHIGQHEVATKSRKRLPLIRNPVLSLARKLMSEPGTQNMQQQSFVRRNNLANWIKINPIREYLSYLFRKTKYYITDGATKSEKTVATIIIAFGESLGPSILELPNIWIGLGYNNTAFSRHLRRCLILNLF